MNKSVFAIFDGKAGAFADPFYSHTKDTAIRDFLAASSVPDSIIQKFPEDFILFHIATFDPHNARFENLGPENLGSAAALIQRRQNAQK